MTSRLLLCLVALLALAPLGRTAPYDAMDYGPFISPTHLAPGNNVVHRGIALHFDAPLPGEAGKTIEVKSGKKTVQVKAGECGALFDTELLRNGSYWTGGYIN